MYWTDVVKRFNDYHFSINSPLRIVGLERDSRKSICIELRIGDYGVHTAVLAFDNLQRPKNLRLTWASTIRSVDDATFNIANEALLNLPKHYSEDTLVGFGYAVTNILLSIGRLPKLLLSVFLTFLGLRLLKRH